MTELSLEQQFQHKTFVDTVNRLQDIKSAKEIAIDLHHLHLATIATFKEVIGKEVVEIRGKR